VILQDVRYALRSLWRSKGFAATAILCLGFGIGVNATLFSVMDGVLLKPYPYTDPDRILVVGEKYEKSDGTAGLSFLDMRDWNEANSVFTTIAGTAGRSFAVSDSGAEPSRYLGAGISWDLFPLLGTAPILGHGFSKDDDRPGGGGVVIISHDLWTNRYQADSGIIGRTILINGTPHTVIGVMPPGFAFPNTQRLWVPLTPMAAEDKRDNRNLFAFGRLKPGATPERAKQELDAIAARIAKAYPETNAGWSSSVRTLREAFLPEEVPIIILMMMSGATLVLCIACSNVANLLLARAATRRREISLRTALGARRGSIVKQLLTESVVLNLVSVPLGIMLAVIGTRLISGAMPPDQVPYYVTWEVDLRSLLYTVAIAVGTAMAFGLFPALSVTRGNLHDALKEGTRGNSANRSVLRSGLVVVQVALALVCLVGALLFVRSFANLDSANVGFDTKPLMTMRFYMTGKVYDLPDARLRRVEDVIHRIEALPAVQAVFASNFVPLSGGGGGGNVTVEGRPSKAGEDVGITLIGVTAGFVRTLGVGIKRGRDFTESEGSTKSPFAVITEGMAKRFWPSTEALGGRFRVGSNPETDPWFTVIGVMPDVNLYGIEPGNVEPPIAAFVPYAYQQSLNTGLTIRVGNDPSSITSAVRAQLRASDSNLPLAFTRTMEDARRLNFWQYGLYGWIFGTIGVVGLLLAAVGVYGVLSYSVEQRTQEIGVRVALGAGRRAVLGLIIRYGVFLTVIGVAIGLVVAPFATVALSSQFFYGVSPFDPLSFGGVALMLIVVSFIASYLPARRALRVDPITALRGE
jgi:putative ABC transport system permease protein